MISKQIVKLLKRRGKKGRKRGEKEEKKTKRKKEKVWCAKKGILPLPFLEAFFKSGMGRLSKSK